MDFSEYNVWFLLVQFAIIFGAVLLGNTLRRKVKFVKNSLLPASVIGGVIIFIIKFIPKVSDFIDSDFMEILTYHCLGLGFKIFKLS